ncbi:MAG: 30S ribosomal protein S17 [Candidatus Aminicenantes bacterium]|nr:30S ribosomal protein S17 [Candidatus Aminicenantes bacterium]MDH5714262.1 30S ribosomal protein S17 [Candidatus Aminicenantes bacterium]
MGETVRRRMMLKGTVVSDKMDKSVVVQVERLEKHPLYQKFVRRRTKLLAHDETNNCKMGDKVVIVESRPMSRKKRWRVKEVLKRSEEEP